jgi:hypothetical protein
MVREPKPPARKSSFFEDPVSGNGGRWGKGGNGILPGQHDPKVRRRGVPHA